MDAMDATSELHDWELLDSDPAPVTNPFDENDDDSGGLIQANYFSLDAHKTRHVEEDKEELLDDQESAGSDNPSWIDPENPTRYLGKVSGGEFWSDSSSERSEDARKYGEFVGGRGAGTGFPEAEEGNKEVILEGVGEEEKGGNFEEGCDGGVLELRDERPGGVEEIGDKKSGGGGGIEKRGGLVWWKMPVEFLRYFVFKMSPVWTVSVAAAVMGFVILGRRLYRMKRKAKGLQIKVTVDDKKVSQVMSRAARLNEAFSVVKRVPVIRPSLPAVGVTPWSVMNLR